MTPDQPNPYAAPQTINSRLVDTHKLFDGKLNVAAIGMKTMHVGILLLLVQVIAMFVVPVVGVGVLPSILGLIVLATLALIACGPFFCLRVPAESGLRPFAVTTVLTELAAVAFGLGSLITFSNELLLAWFLFTLVSAAVFLLFLYRLSVAIRRFDLSRRSRSVFVLGALMTTTFGGGIVMGNMSRSVFLIAILFCTALGSGLLFMAGYANLLNGLSNAIRHPDGEYTARSSQ